MSRIDVLNAPVRQSLIRLSVPMAIGILAIVLFNVVDTIFVGQLGKAELAAMSFTFPVVFTITSLAIGIGTGTTSAIARAIGGGDRTQVRRLTTDALLLALLLVTLVAAIGLVTIDPLFRLLGATDDMIVLIRKYMIPWYFGVGMLVIPMVGNAAIRASGDTKTPSLVMIVAGLTNAALDPILIFGLGPIPKLGLTGAAVATIGSYGFALMAALYILHRRERMLDLKPAPLADVLHSWRVILYVGMPAAATQMLVPMASAILTRMVAQYGEVAVAAYGVGGRLESLGMLPIFALSVGLTPLVAQNLGAQQLERVSETLRQAQRLGIGLGIIVAAFYALTSSMLVHLFSQDTAIQQLTRTYLIIVPISYAGVGLALIGASFFNALGHPSSAVMVVLTRLVVLTIPLAWIGSITWGVEGIFAGIALANMTVGAFTLYLTRQHIRHRFATL